MREQRGGALVKAAGKTERILNPSERETSNRLFRNMSIRL